ncbi:MAG: SsrA-binding protein SmpB [Gemmatimonadota bacterium]|nr:MAG: SsrA-binding protein SmpB [Gemmatimonadota bacterium]
MSLRSEPRPSTGRVVASNRKARHDYHIEETWEAGLVLTGSEIKSVRAGKVSLKGAYGTIRGGEIWLEGMNIAPYDSGGYANHEPERSRKLLMHRREIRRLVGALERRGLTLIPLDLHLSDGWAKVTLALGRGKKTHDKREDVKRRDADREAARALGRRR